MKKSFRYQNPTHHFFLYFYKYIFHLFGSKSVFPGCLMQELHREGKAANYVDKAKTALPDEQKHNLPQKRNPSALRADFSCNKRTCNQYLNVNDFHMKPSEKEKLFTRSRSLSSLKPILSLLSYLATAIKGASE